jgi:two-component system, cell cycle sensor histidine kinase and response regulator CckA
VADPNSPGTILPATNLPPTILIVEDEEDVRELTRDVLEMNGFTVLESLDPADAIRIAETHPGSIDLLITDVVMPRMSGPELARRLRETRPALRVLCMSGYPESAERGAAGASQWTAWLQKPFNPDGLILKVRECLTS